MNVCEAIQELEEVDNTWSLTLSNSSLQRIMQASKEDPVLQSLREAILHGWPGDKSEVPEVLRAYYSFRDELVVQDQLVFKGHQLIIPRALRKEMMEAAHASHIGIESCIRRARESMFWPRMSCELKDYIAKCDICLTHRSMPVREPLNQHEFVARPWSKISADLCDLRTRPHITGCL